MCGAVHYEVKSQPIIVAQCYCENCQRGSGAGHTTGAMFSVDDFNLKGETSEYKYLSDNGNEVTRVFCKMCGSPVFGKNNGMEGYITITLGTFDDSSNFEPEVAVFTRNQKKWDTIDKKIPMFEAQPDWKPDDKI